MIKKFRIWFSNKIYKNYILFKFPIIWVQIQLIRTLRYHLSPRQHHCIVILFSTAKHYNDINIMVLIFVVILHPLHEWPRYSWVPLFRAFRAGLLVVLALYGFATNTYVWRTTGVNSTLIFEFNPRNYRSFTQLFEVWEYKQLYCIRFVILNQIASLMGVIWIICAYLFVFAHWLNIPHEIGPSVLLLIFPIILCLPLPVFYWHSRVWFLRILVSSYNQELIEFILLLTVAHK